MMGVVLGEEMRMVNNEFTISHSKRIGLFNQSCQEVEHEDVFFTAEVVKKHLKVDVL